MSITYFALKALISENTSAKTYDKYCYQLQQDNLFIGPNVTFCSGGKEARLDTPDLALEYADRVKPILEERYGEEVDLLVVSISMPARESSLRKVHEHSKLIRARLDQNAMSPTRKPT